MNKEYIQIEAESRGNTSDSKIFIGENNEVLDYIKNDKKVNIVYIDAPYNTGKEVFFDNRKGAWERRINWRDMLYQRISKCYDLLDETGIILFSIDDNELVTATEILNSVFGKENFICSFIWRRRDYSESNERYISVEHEYIICYGKSKKYNINYKFSTWIDSSSRRENREDNYYELNSVYQDSARNYINNLFNKKVVENYPKPVDLLQEVFSIFVKDGDTVLDIFGGSGTSGEACMKISVEKNIHVNFILIQISKPKPERISHNIANLTVKRNQRAFDWINKNYTKGYRGFVVYEDSSYMGEVVFKEI